MEVDALSFIREFELFVLVVEIFVLIALFRMIQAVNRERQSQIGELRKEIVAYQKCHDKQHRQETERLTTDIEILKGHMIEIQTRMEYLQKGNLGNPISFPRGKGEGTI